MTKRARIDPLVAEVAAVLAPIAATAGDKADWLVARLREPGGKLEGWRPRGLGEAVRRLRADLPDEDILAGAHNLLLEVTSRERGGKSVV